ncbi:nucleoside hydrolase [Cohnella pontilimi]|uniref:Nucleoside hydrolase n=1 Tax=Cohnella pontilimi TaxID=2564100 RepID=A0A4U0FEM7_9BACL|nr:nucleoside hydrolase [Cohnella pontilimi]TJY43325.1 nucleoside hydrolase [Cohnella pontilimi]
MSATRIILDVDTGIDDALALLYAVKSDDIQLEGVTTVFGNVSVEQATVNTLQVLELAGAPASVPVVKGADRPLVRKWEGPVVHIHGDNGLGGFRLPPPSRQAAEGRAAEYLVRKINELGRDLTLVFVGRLTNLAHALAIDPSIAGKVNRLVLMGGALRAPGNVTPTAEANIWGDPEAAHRVFESGMPITMVGLDVTMQTVMKEEHVALVKRKAGTAGERTAEFIEQILAYYFSAYEKQNGFYGSPLHDLLAVAVAGDPTLVGTEELAVKIETKGELSSGATIGDLRGKPDYAVNASVCVSVDSERFLSRFIDVLASGAPSAQ